MMIKTLWFNEFNFLVRGEWYNEGSDIAPILKYCLNVNPGTVISVVMKLAEAKRDATKQAAGGGRKFKLEADNEGLIFVALSLNMVSSPSMATCICNSINCDSDHVIANTDFKRTFRIFGTRC